MFHEFLLARGRARLAEALLQAAETLEPPRGPVQQQAAGVFGEYLVVGGMPEAVTRWVEDFSAVAVRQVHSDLLQSLSEDIRKYRGARDLAPIEAAFDSLRLHYGSRFKYENFAPGYKSLQMKKALARLEGAMICRQVWPTSDLRPPLRVKPRSAPKLLPLDIGLAADASDAPKRRPIDWSRAREPRPPTG